MKEIVKYIVDRVAIATECLDTGVITISKKVEEVKHMTFKKDEFYRAQDGSKPRIDTGEDGETIKIYYRYHISNLIEIDVRESAFNHCFYKSEINANRDGYVRCNRCGKWTTRYIIQVRDTPNLTTSYFCSRECANDAGFIRCDDCGNWRPSFLITRVEEANRNVCSKCLPRAFKICAMCGDKHHYALMDEAEDFSDPWHSLFYCKKCYHKAREFIEEHKINSYHEAKGHNDWHFLYTPKEVENKFSTGLDYIGTELEIEVTDGNTPENVTFATRQILNKTSDGKLAHFEHDGSLNRGVEIIFNPMTINYIYSKEELLRKTFTELSKVARSHDTRTCGLHVHYSRRKFDESAVCSLIYLFEKFKSPIEKLARRKSNNYAQFYDISISGDIGIVLNEIKYCYEDYDRYMVVNTHNSNTLEIRIFKGTLKFETYMATIEFVNSIMQFVLNSDLDTLSKATFKDIVTYLPTKYLLPYCEERGIALELDTLSTASLYKIDLPNGVVSTRLDREDFSMNIQPFAHDVISGREITLTQSDLRTNINLETRGGDGQCV